MVGILTEEVGVAKACLVRVDGFCKGGGGKK